MLNRDGSSVVGPVSADPLVEEVRHALAHLHEPAYLQRLALTRRVGASAVTSSGRLLQRRLTEAIQVLRPGPQTAPDSHAWRTYRLLELRYLDALPVEEVRRQVAVSRSEYYRDHQAALLAVCSVVREQGIASANPPSRGDVPVADRVRLPAYLTSFVGRTSELQSVSQLLTEQPVARLVTIIGPPGTGKTRLAVEVARAMAATWPDGVTFVPLAPVADAGAVLQAVAQALDVRDDGRRPLLEAIRDYLREKQMLLVVDNVEHLLRAAPHLVDLLGACPGLAILATSRALLRVDGEREVPLAPFPLPDPGVVATPEVAAASDAVRLFVERAAAVLVGFRLTDANAFTVAALCRRLDGLPLAIELAAARLRLLTVEQLAVRLGDRFHLLTGGNRSAAPHQQTLRSLVDWSHDILAEPERVLWRRLAVFPGGWTLEAAEEVCADDKLSSAEVLDRLAELADNSLVQVDHRRGVARYRFLETIRDYGLERLAAAGESDAIRARHAAWFVRFAERVAPELEAHRQDEWLDALEEEHANLRAALAWCAASPSRREAGARIVGSLGRFWAIRGLFAEARWWCVEIVEPPSAPGAIERAGGPAVYFRALQAGVLPHLLQGDYATTLAMTEPWVRIALKVENPAALGFFLLAGVLALINLGRYAEAELRIDQALTIFRASDHRIGQMRAFHLLALLARLRGDYAGSREYHTRSLMLAREQGDLWYLGHILSGIGLTAYQQGDYDPARTCFEEVLPIRERLRDRPGMAWTLINLGDVARAQGDEATARERFEAALVMLRDLGDRSGMADALASLGRLARDQGDLAVARERLAASLAIRRDLGHRLALPGALEDAAAVEAAAGELARAARLAGAAAAQRNELGARISPDEQRAIDQWLAPALANEPVLASAYADGQSLTLEEAIEVALGRADDQSARPLAASPPGQ